MQMTGDNHGPPSEEDIEKLLAYAEKEMPGIKIHLEPLMILQKPFLPRIRLSQQLKEIHQIHGYHGLWQILRNLRLHETSGLWNQL